MNTLNFFTQSIIESLLFYYGSTGISVHKLAKSLNCNLKQALQYLLDLSIHYENSNHGLELAITNQKVYFVIKNQIANYLLKQNKITIKKYLSNAALEVLAIIAFNQDKQITKSEINYWRGVYSNDIIRSLIEKGLISVDAIAENKAGFPCTYKITKKFLDKFNLKSLSEIPKFTINNNNTNTSNTNIFQLNVKLKNKKNNNNLMIYKNENNKEANSLKENNKTKITNLKIKIKKTDQIDKSKNTNKQKSIKFNFVEWN